MADLKITKLIIDGNNYIIPDAAADQKGLMSSSDFSKLAGIASGAEVNKIDQIQINNAAVAIASKIVNIAVATGDTNGTIKIGEAEVLVKGLAALAYKAQISQSDLESALSSLITTASTNASEVPGIKTTLETLQGSGTGSIKKMIDDAFNTFVTETTENGVIDKFAEMVQWFADHGDAASEAGQLLADVQALQAILAGIGGTSEPATVAAYITQELSKLNLGQYVTTTSLTSTLDGYVKKEDGKGLSSNDFTAAYKAKLDSLSETLETIGVTYSYDAATQSLTLNGLSEAS